MLRLLGLALTMAGLLLGVAWTVPAEAAGPLTVQLGPQGNSGESGTATLTEAGSKTKVVLDVKGQPANPQPVHVHKGTCDKLDEKPAYGLTTLANGKSETTIDATLASLQSGGFAINGHKSAQDAKTYVFCGNIPKM